MNIQDYSSQAITTLLGDHAITDMDATLLSQVFGLMGESGEVAEKFKKLIRDKKVSFLMRIKPRLSKSSVISYGILIQSLIYWVRVSRKLPRRT